VGRETRWRVDACLVIRATAILTILVLPPPLALAQTGPSRPEIEQRLASVPEDRRAYARFWNWVAALPLGERGATENAPFQQDVLLKKYRTWLVETGSSPSEADQEVAALQHRGGAEVAEFWNRYLVTARPPWLTSEPNAFLAQMVKGRKTGKALDVGMGQGRNSIWLATQGWDVTGFDPADQAVAAAQEEAKRRGVIIHTEVTTMEQFDFGEGRWDLIAVIYAGCSSIAPQLQKALKPGGILVEEAFHTDALKTLKVGGSLCKPGELPSAFQDLRVIRYEEPIATPDFAPRPARVVRFAAEKPID